MKKLSYPLLILCCLIPELLVAQDTVATAAPNNAVITNDTPFAILYVYRPRNYVGSLISYNIHLDDSVICRIRNNTKYAIKIYREGTMELWAETEAKRKVKLTIAYGQSYYLKCGVTMGIMAGRPDLQLVFPEQGKLDYENLDAKNSKGKGEN